MHVNLFLLNSTSSTNYQSEIKMNIKIISIKYVVKEHCKRTWDIKIRVSPNSPCNVTHGLKEFKIHSPKNKEKQQKCCV